MICYSRTFEVMRINLCNLNSCGTEKTNSQNKHWIVAVCNKFQSNYILNGVVVISHSFKSLHVLIIYLRYIYLLVHSLAKKRYFHPFTTRYIDVNISQWFSDFELHHLLLKCVYIPHSLFSFNRKCKHVKLKVKYFLCSFHCSSLFLYYFFWGKSTGYSPLLVCCCFFCNIFQFKLMDKSI